VSDFHAKLVRRGDKWSVHDQMSTNKTRVNGEVVLKRFLSSKDVLEFGATKALLLLPGGKSGAKARGGSKAKSSGTASSGGAIRWVLMGLVLAAVAGAAWYFMNQ
jgi:pSer/pThr/pTyr-binding forkhead associated (FHA) protein